MIARANRQNQGWMERLACIRDLVDHQKDNVRHSQSSVDTRAKRLSSVALLKQGSQTGPSRRS